MEHHGSFLRRRPVIKTAPRLGEHNEEILKDAGYSEGEIKSLQR